MNYVVSTFLTLYTCYCLTSANQRGSRKCLTNIDAHENENKYSKNPGIIGIAGLYYPTVS